MTTYLEDLNLANQKMNSRRFLMGTGAVLLTLTLAACGNSNSKSAITSSTKTSRHRSANMDYRLSGSSQPLTAGNLQPKQNAALVMYYEGVKNNQQYVRQMTKGDQGLTINLLAPSAAKQAGVKAALPDGAQVLYQVQLTKGGASSYYTIVGDQTYLADGHGGFRKQPVTTQAMVDLANKNNAGRMIDQLSDHATLNDQRDGGNDASTTTKSTSQGDSMSFDDALALLKKAGIPDTELATAGQFHDGSHPDGKGGYVLNTYPGAKGKDIFTITKTGKGKYHITASYGSIGTADGSFAPFSDPSTYGPTAVDVSN